MPKLPSRLACLAPWRAAEGGERREVGSAQIDVVAPQVVVIEPGHDGWRLGDEPALLIEFDIEGYTLSRLGMLA